MGFFSAVKRFFGQKPPEAQKPGNAIADTDQAQAVRSVAADSAKTPPVQTETAPVEAPASEANEHSEVSESGREEREHVPAQPEKPQAKEVEDAVPEKVAKAAAREAISDEKAQAPETWESVPEKLAEAVPREETAEKAPLESSARTEKQQAPEALEAVSEKAAEPVRAEEIAIKDAGQQHADETASPADDAILVRLRAAKPRLSDWLEIVLEGQDETNEEFWRRLKFFLNALEAPENEINAFISDFARWLERMEYNHVDEFRSELQYRLALALDLEDEEDERNRLLLKLSQGLAATREQLGRRLDNLFARHGELDASFWEEMEEMFIMADMGYEASLEIVERLKRRAAKQKATSASEGKRLLMDELEEIFRQQPRIKAANKPEVILMMGVNGAGKTTTIAKLAHRAKMEGKKTLIVAADTFRAAAIEQLQVWAERAGSEFYAKPAGSDPASVAWEAMDCALKNDIDVVFVDTAGRLQTRVNLMEELGKIRQVLGRKQPGAPHRSILVLDATTGQNALSQAKLFREAAGADEIALTKLDGTAKGGVAIAVAMRENLPITFIGLGEKMEDLRPFNGRDFASALLNAA